MCQRTRDPLPCRPVRSARRRTREGQRPWQWAVLRDSDGWPPTSRRWPSPSWSGPIATIAARRVARPVPVRRRGQPRMGPTRPPGERARGCRWPTLKSWSGSPPDSRHHPESGGTLTPRGVVVVDPGRSYGLVFGHSRPLCPIGRVSCVSGVPNPTRRVQVTTQLAPRCSGSFLARVRQAVVGWRSVVEPKPRPGEKKIPLGTNPRGRS